MTKLSSTLFKYILQWDSTKPNHAQCELQDEREISLHRTKSFYQNRERNNEFIKVVPR